MKYALSSNHSESSPFLFFPIFSVVFHSVLFLFFAIVGNHQTTEEMNTEVLIAMVDLKELLPPVSIPSSPVRPIKEQISASTPTSEVEVAEETPSEPILDPELDEELEDVSEATVTLLIEGLNNIVIPLPPSASPREEVIPEVESTLEETPLPKALSEDKAEEAFLGETLIPSDTEAIKERFTLSEPMPSDSPDPIPSPSESEPAPKLAVQSSVEPPALSTQEITKPSETRDTLFPSPGKKILASIKRPIEEKKLPPPLPPEPKRSKAKIKKSGLLGLLGDKKRGHKTKHALFAKIRTKKKRGTSALDKSMSSPGFSKVNQNISRLKQRLLTSEKNRLMKRKSPLKPRKSILKIVQGSGHNFGILSSAIAQEEWRLTHVYNRLLQKNPNLQGNLIIEFTISPKGKVKKSNILTSSFGNPAFEKALIQAISLWTFPSSQEGETTVLYPLSFFPKS